VVVKGPAATGNRNTPSVPIISTTAMFCSQCILRFPNPAYTRLDPVETEPKCEKRVAISRPKRSPETTTNRHAGAIPVEKNLTQDIIR
jgi:hypothetical protein